MPESPKTNAPEPAGSEATRRALSQVFHALWIRSATAFSFPAAVPPDPGSAAPVSDLAERQQLVLALRDTLYRRCFARPLDEWDAAEQTPAPSLPHADLVKRLSSANQGRDVWLHGWRIERVEADGSVALANGSWRRIAEPGHYGMTFSENMPPRAGAAATLCLRKESLTLQAGVYYALGTTLPEPEDERAVVRFYLYASGEAVVPVFEAVTTYLNAWQTPFTLKTMLEPQDHDRCDATVLYLPGRRYERFIDLLRTVPPSTFSGLKPAVPLFTKPLRAGVGLAENPGQGESFGMHRCRLVAEALVEAWTAGCQDVATRLQTTEQRFASEGLSLDQPYLNPGSQDAYTVP